MAPPEAMVRCQPSEASTAGRATPCAAQRTAASWFKQMGASTKVLWLSRRRRTSARARAVPVGSSSAACGAGQQSASCDGRQARQLAGCRDSVVGRRQLPDFGPVGESFAGLDQGAFVQQAREERLERGACPSLAQCCCHLFPGEPAVTQRQNLAQEGAGRADRYRLARQAAFQRVLADMPVAESQRISNACLHVHGCRFGAGCIPSAEYILRNSPELSGR
jgi:hypothetical protein